MDQKPDIRTTLQQHSCWNTFSQWIDDVLDMTMKGSEGEAQEFRTQIKQELTEKLGTTNRVGPLRITVANAVAANYGAKSVRGENPIKFIKSEIARIVRKRKRKHFGTTTRPLESASTSLKLGNPTIRDGIYGKGQLGANHIVRH